MIDHYILIGQTPVPCELMEWASWFENIDNRRVALWELGPLRVSTVFLGLDHNWGFEGPPVLFETMSFLGRASLWQSRCCTWTEAECQHRRAVCYAKRMILAHPLETIRAIAEALHGWMKDWDRRFSYERYGKVLPLFGAEE